MQAETFDEWRAAAVALDALEGNNAWKEEDESPDYDAALVLARLKALADARMSCDIRQIVLQLRTALARNLGGMGSLRMYQHSHVGTKKLVDRYIKSVHATLAALLDISAKQGEECPFTPRQLVDAMKQTRQSFGRSALLLSGGGTFGMKHIGVVKNLWETNLLPHVISGASAGSIVAAVVCTRTDKEMPAIMHEFCHGDLAVFQEADTEMSFLSKVVQTFQTSGAFNIVHLTRVMKGLLGDMTFLEAYNRTQRILNIPVSTSTHFELPRLLNHLTAPNVIIYSAVCTSCSVPVLYMQSSLVAKDPKTGEQVQWDPNPDTTWIDGSVDNDLPMQRLAEMWNVDHFIVSQVNPHVVPFLDKDEELKPNEAKQHMLLTAGHEWMMKGLGAARSELVHRMQILVDMGIKPSVVTKLQSVLSQRYSGDINIFPHVPMVDFPKVLKNPTPEYMMGCMLAGQKATWPRLSRIQNHVSIEFDLDATVRELEARALHAEMEAERIKDGRPASTASELARSRSTHRISGMSDMGPPSPVLRKSAPTTPSASRASLRIPLSNVYTAANSSRRRTGFTTAEHVKTPDLDFETHPQPEEDSSDRDYFAEADDTDASERQYSSSPVTSPTQDDAPAPSIAQRVPTPGPPQMNATYNRRNSILLSLEMTAATLAGPSSPERRYKKLFHPAPATEQDAEAGASVAQGGRRNSSGEGRDVVFMLGPEETMREGREEGDAQ